MRIDPEVVRGERLKRGWSQQHLATVTGLGLRTIQRIEQSGAASYESAQALAACFELALERIQAPLPRKSGRGRLVSRRAAGIGMAASFLAGALLMTMHGVIAEDIFVDLGVSLSSSEDQYETQVLLNDHERTEVPLPGGYRLAVTPEIFDDGTVKFEFEIYDDRAEPAHLIARPAVMTKNGTEFRIIQGNTAPAAASGRSGDASGTTEILDIKGRPVLLDAARQRAPPTEAIAAEAG